MRVMAKKWMEGLCVAVVAHIPYVLLASFSVEGMQFLEALFSIHALWRLITYTLFWFFGFAPIYAAANIFFTIKKG